LVTIASFLSRMVGTLPVFKSTTRKALGNDHTI
jgi:hypothetical protein